MGFMNVHIPQKYGMNLLLSCELLSHSCQCILFDGVCLFLTKFNRKCNETCRMYWKRL